MADGLAWSEEEDSLLRAKYQSSSKLALMSELQGRTWLAIKRRAGALRLLRLLPWGGEDDAKLKDVYSKVENNRLPDIFPGRTLLAIQTRARSLGLRRMMKSPKSEWNNPDLRFWRNVQVNLGGCWEWMGAKDKGGYGRFYVGRGRRESAHVYSYESVFGTVPIGKELDHLCRTRHCIHPLHVEPVSHRENCARGLPGGYAQRAARNRTRTHCIHGHAFTPKNTRRNFGKRECMECHRIRESNRRTAKKEAIRGV